MLSLLTFITLSTHALLASARVVKSERGLPIDISALAACDSVKSQLSNQSQVFNFFAPDYSQDIRHYAISSTQLPACVIEPGSAEDVAAILKVVAERRIEFAVQSGGHAYNPGFSSTTGIHISLSRFNQIEISEDQLTVDVGPGQPWTRVYEEFDQTGRMVVGGRVDGPGVGGFLSGGGGFSWLSNEYGLSVDNVEQYTLVTPTGTVLNVSATSEPALFSALKGTGNNLGIITNFKLRTVEQAEQVYGGVINYAIDQYPRILSALTHFSSSNNTDNKAALIASVNAIAGLPASTLQIYYNGATPPAETFADFLAIPALSKDVSTRSYLSLVKSIPSDAVANLRARSNTAPVKAYSANFLRTVTELVQRAGVEGLAHSGLFVTVSLEPFTSGAFSHSAGDEAFQHNPENACFPTFLTAAYTLPTDDTYWQTTLQNMTYTLLSTAAADGQDLAACPFYPNYAAASTPLDRLFIGNLSGLQTLKQQYDPDNVMGLTGGFRL